MIPTEQTTTGQRGQKQAVLSCHTPGHARRKLMMIIFGLCMLGFGLSQIWTPLRLLVCGGRATAAATRVIKTKAGLPDQFLSDDLHIKAKEETHDRSYVFWNEFGFETEDGRGVVVRSPIGSQLKPLFPLLDDDGLPMELAVYYDPHHPEIVAFPTIFSTWFAPGALVILGLIATIVGGFLLAWANTPIELPHLSAPK